MNEDLSPAERYAEMKMRHKRTAVENEIARSADINQFAQFLSHDLDEFQLQACHALESGSSVLVAAPTGAGKTVVGEFAIHLAVRLGVKVFYTTPIKALSNQKFQQLQRRYGEDMVGLLTGDTVINPEAQIVVMTTEVLRNMIYAGSSTLNTLGYVVLDEVHYLADKFRGAVWEEVIIHLRPSVQLVSLSATVSNAEEFGSWLDEVRGNTKVIVSELRPVPLWQHVLVRGEVYDLFVNEDGRAVPAQGPQTEDKVVNPELERALHARAVRGDEVGGRPHRHAGSSKREFGRRGRSGGKAHRGGHPARELARGRGDSASGQAGGARSARSWDQAEVSAAIPAARQLRRPGVLQLLNQRDLLPAITFVFSRAGCDDAVLQCLRDDLVLTNEEQSAEIYEYACSRIQNIPKDDLKVLNFRRWLRALCNGYAAHHAGMLPTFKEIVEHLFARGLVKAVFATETLALGVNMPARTVVLEKLVKWNGTGHVDITAGEFTQLTGRAGRRGIDVEGHAVVLGAAGLEAEQVANLASKRTYPLKSSFVPTCNMAVNLVAQVGVREATGVLETSFAQFQADRGVVGLAKRARELQDGINSYRKAAYCQGGDVQQYFSVRQAISAREQVLSRQRGQERRETVVSWLKALSAGTVIRVVAGKSQGFAAIVDNGIDGGGEPRPQIITLDGRLKRLSMQDFPQAPVVLGNIRVPRHMQLGNAKARRDIASQMRSLMHEKGRMGHHALVERYGEHGEEIPYQDAVKIKIPSKADTDGKLLRLKDDLAAHPVHVCPEREQHMRWMERWARSSNDLEQVQRKISSRTDSIGAHFVKLVGLLTSLGYLECDVDGEYAVTDAGERLRRIYGEQDLLIAECIRAGIWDDLDAGGLATAVSAVIFQARRDEGMAADSLPSENVQVAVVASQQLWRDVVAAQRAHRVNELPQLDTSMAPMMYRWAHGADLAETLRGSDQAPGDFVRWAKQVIDVLDQIASDKDLRQTAKAAIELVRRGIVAYSVMGGSSASA